MTLNEFLKQHAPEKTKIGRLCRILLNDKYLKGSNSDMLAIISTYRRQFGKQLIDEFFVKLKELQHER